MKKKIENIKWKILYRLYNFVLKKISKLDSPQFDLLEIDLSFYEFLCDYESEWFCENI